MLYGSLGFHPTTLYILKMKSPKKYYVGTTTRHFLTRLGEHRNHMYCKWTRKHGLGRVVTRFSIDPKGSTRLKTTCGCTSRGSTVHITYEAGTLPYVIDTQISSPITCCPPSSVGLEL